VRTGANATLGNLLDMVASRINTFDYRLKSSRKMLGGPRRLNLEELLSDGSVLLLLPRMLGGALLGKSLKGRTPGLDLEEKFMRQREYDAQNQKYQIARNELNRRMEQERANAQINQLKIQNQWRKIMRLAKVESLRKGIEILSQNHERDVDRKDAIIQMLDRDLEEAEGQFHMSLRSHLQNVDHLIELQDTRLLKSEQEFEHELCTLEVEFQAEKGAIVKQHVVNARELHDIIAAIDREEQEHGADTKQEHDQLGEEIRNRNLEEINMLRIGLDSEIEDLEQHFETAHLNYLQTTDQRTHDFKYYTKKDQELSKEIEIKIRKIERLQANLHHWRTKLTQNTRESAQRNEVLLLEKNKVLYYFQQLKVRMNMFRRVQICRLAELTQDAHTCKQKISKRVVLAERIIVLAETARRMETEQEKIVPFQNTIDPSNPIAAISSAKRATDTSGLLDHAYFESGGKAEVHHNALALQTSTWMHDGGPVPKWSHLDQFLQKYNKVLLDKLAIESERKGLEQENTELQAILKQYFDGVSVNDSVMQASNPLLIVNGKVKAPPQTTPMDRMEQSTVVDANHMVTTSRVGTSFF